jgi:hypothetical protein
VNAMSIGISRSSLGQSGTSRRLLTRYPQPKFGGSSTRSLHLRAFKSAPVRDMHQGRPLATVPDGLLCVVC